MGVPIVRECPAASGRMLALTFDDGPSENTPKVLEVFAAHDCHATFFVLGEAIERDPLHPELLRRAVAAGHELGNHTYSHPHLGELGEDAVRDELDRTAALIARHSGEPPRVMRCPYGEDQQRIAGLLHEDALISWSVDPEDWSDPEPAEIVERVLAGAAPGGIVCMHDGPGRAKTAEALATLVPELQARGFELVTVSELLRRCQED